MIKIEFRHKVRFNDFLYQPEKLEHNHFLFKHNDHHDGPEDDDIYWYTKNGFLSESKVILRRAFRIIYRMNLENVSIRS